ncbi:chemotaxis protein [Enterovibrio coralii]|uniref:Chemotaxis protein n=1 Tax=Enterovibrio coralii TaxID=294935 RepID=A0A135IBX5_9GAMM|nr:chemotaxis protein [Enterovibrio coralii]KXF82960.1 chemotaxis protein [Enterovibrio coralii]
MAATMLSGCSMLEIQIESQTVPLTKQELNARVMTREYAQQFFSQVEQAADKMHQYYEPRDQVNQSNVLLWKINAIERMQSAAYQVSPMAGLIDVWVFSYQLDDFFSVGEGKELFVGSEAKDVSKHLANEMDRVAQSILSASNYPKAKAFVQKHAEQYPFRDLSFNRTPAYRLWVESNGGNEQDAVTTLGTMPEAIGDMSDKMSLFSEQTPKIMTWKAQLLALNSMNSIDQVNQAVDSFKVVSDSMNDFIRNNPEYMRHLAEEMAVKLQPLVDNIDQKTADHLLTLSTERMLLEQMIARERVEVASIITSEREALVEDVNTLSKEIVDVVMNNLIEMIRSLILYFVLFIVVIFFAPLGLGYMLGRRSAK